MRRFIIRIEDYSERDIRLRNRISPEDECQITEEDHRLFNQQAGLQRLMVCENCGSYVVAIRPFYQMLGLLDDHDELGCFASEIVYMLRESLIWNEEQWKAYMEGKLPPQRLIYKSDGLVEEDGDGNLFSFKYNECAFIFDPKCSCFPVMCGTKEGIPHCQKEY